MSKRAPIECTSLRSTDYTGIYLTDNYFNACHYYSYRNYRKFGESSINKVERELDELDARRILMINECSVVF